MNIKKIILEEISGFEWAEEYMDYTPITFEQVTKLPIGTKIKISGDIGSKTFNNEPVVKLKQNQPNQTHL